MNNKLCKKITSGLVTGCLVLSFGGLAIARDAQSQMLPPGPPPMHEDMEEHINSDLNKLVNEGSVTKEQGDKIISFFKEKDQQHKAEMEKVKTMRPEDGNVHLQPPFNQPPDFMTELKNVANLSDEQAMTIEKTIFKEMPRNGKAGGPGNCCIQTKG